ncbi:DUF1295 domain-containing protein [Aeromicrobium massiliense]|uniref:DUF1295 domain-containing protein n=1 Tax=Aeromicrobium massiliense TaxID=1464554 RepID=UPI000318BB87|nr:DUF1295 domain-containing protein [Aeromicrobium massiliense]
MSPNDLSQTGWALLAGLAAVVLTMAVTYVWARRTGLLSVVDTVWGLGFVPVAVASTAVSLAGGGDALTRWLLLGLTTVWAVRLGTHVHRRNHGKGEDPRYRDVLERHPDRGFGQTAVRSVLGPQGLGMYVVAAPLMVGPQNEGHVTWLVVLGVAVWAVGLFFETVGDRQLEVYKRDPAHRGQVMDTGLWRYTRHPNYFGDACVWWGLGLVAASSWPGVVALLGPAVMTYSLVNVTGAKLNEQGQQRKPGWASYARRTSYFVPLPPRKG